MRPYHPQLIRLLPLNVLFWALLLVGLSGASSLDGLSFHFNAVGGDYSLWFRKNDREKFRIVPNSDFHPAYGAMYRHQWGFSISPGFSGTDQVEKNRPPTFYFDIQPFYYGHRFGGDLYYLYYRGFYRENSDPLDPATNFPGTRISLAGLNLYYLLNHKKESLNSLLMPPDDKKSGFLFPVLFDVTRRNVHADGSLPPSSEDSAYPLFSQIRDLTITHTTLGSGVSYYRTWYGFFVIPTVLVGLGPQYRDMPDPILEPWGLAVKINMKIIFGYRGRHFQMAIQAINNSDVLRAGEEVLQFMSGKVIFSFGWEI